ncbi:helix-turn-helix domain-containing protein [Gemmata sp.]|uniref:helix-turn-helix domain-containing protein n=1 Tax=Gemmata sp. TaxID=1914242 RepID=UPI003F7176A9
MKRTAKKGTARAPASGEKVATRTKEHLGTSYTVSVAHPEADRYPWMGDEELSDLAADIAAHGLKKKIKRLADGRIVDGRNRELACRISSVRPAYETVRLAEEKIPAEVASLNVHRRHLTPEFRRARIEALRAEGKSTRAIAKATGVAQSTVMRDLNHLGSGEPRGSPEPAGNRPPSGQNQAPELVASAAPGEPRGSPGAAGIKPPGGAPAVPEPETADHRPAAVSPPPKVVGLDRKAYSATRPAHARPTPAASRLDELAAQAVAFQQVLEAFACDPDGRWLIGRPNPRAKGRPIVREVMAAIAAIGPEPPGRYETAADRAFKIRAAEDAARHKATTALPAGAVECDWLRGLVEELRQRRAQASAPAAQSGGQT